MNHTSLNPAATQLLPLALGLVCAGVTYAVLAGKTLPLISNPRLALVILLVSGMAMCTSGIGRVAASGRWTSPLAILGYLLGAVILLVIAAAFAGFRLPGIHSPAQAVGAVALLIAVKFALATLGICFGRL
ncbi:MAG: hypothetical protein ACKOC5_04875 [Chloroflexota bacterium]